MDTTTLGSDPKDRLLSLILRDGILYRSATQPIRSRDGSSAIWMLDSLCVSMTSEGLNLAARCLLDLLDKFEGRQIATFGVTAIPLVSACVLLSEGRYESILVRKERKPHGSSKLIEGRIQPNEPVIIIDDSVSSGTTMTACCERLQAAGMRVEGGICLVRFGWYGGFALMQEQGYHMETVFDLDEDLIANMEDEEKPQHNPTKQFPAIHWHEQALDDGLHPAEFCRRVICEYLRSNKLLRPPQRLDRTYHSEGGSWVSVRQRDNIYLRHARDGFWHFPGEKPAHTPHDLALACLQVVRHLPAGDAGLQLMQDSAIAVTFFSKLEACQLGELDNDRYGIVVRSRERLDKMGGALPRMPGIANEWQQYQHARINNAKLVSFEPHTIYRHEVEKVVEADVVWQPSGAPLTLGQLPWFRDKQQAGRVVRRARELIIAALKNQVPEGPSLPASFLHPYLDSIYISIYVDGHVRGCMGTKVRSLDDDLAHLAERVLGDQRFSPLSATDLERIVVKASLLYNPLELGPWGPDEVMGTVLFGQQALMVYQHERNGILLPEIAVSYNYTPDQYALEVIDKAGITRPPYHWRRYDCSSWMDDGRDCRLMDGAFPVPEATRLQSKTLIAARAVMWAQYIQRQQHDNGSLSFYYAPFQDQLTGVLDSARSAHVAWVLARYAKLNPACVASVDLQRLSEYLQGKVAQTDQRAWLCDDPEEDNIVTGTSLLLLALVAGNEQTVALASPLANTLWECIDKHGFIRPHWAHKEPGHDVYQDYLPGQLLLALAQAHGAGHTEVNETLLTKALSSYWHRFQYKRRIDQVSWLTQGLLAWWAIRKDPKLAQRAFVICDWVLTFQSEKHGCFYTDQQVDTPGYTTALYLEALATAARVAGELGEMDRQQTYLKACHAGFQFLDGLVLQERDASVLPNPVWAMGGLRMSQYSSEVRIDFSQHALSAAMELMPWHVEVNHGAEQAPFLAMASSG